MLLHDDHSPRRTRFHRPDTLKASRRYKGGKGGGGGDDPMAQQEAARQAAIMSGDQNINRTFANTFTPEFYNKYQQDYLNYYQPQLQDQYSKAKQQLEYALANQGGLNSTAAGYQEAQLQKQYDLANQQIADQALGSVNTLKGNIQSAKNSLFANLSASGDSAAAAQGAAAQASLLTAPQTYQPLGQLFGNIANTASQQSAFNMMQAYGLGGRGAMNGASVFPTSGSVSVGQ